MNNKPKWPSKEEIGARLHHLREERDRVLARRDDLNAEIIRIEKAIKRLVP